MWVRLATLCLSSTLENTEIKREETSVKRLTVGAGRAEPTRSNQNKPAFLIPCMTHIGNNKQRLRPWIRLHLREEIFRLCNNCLNTRELTASSCGGRWRRPAPATAPSRTSSTRCLRPPADGKNTNEQTAWMVLKKRDEKRRPTEDSSYSFNVLSLSCIVGKKFRCFPEGKTHRRPFKGKRMTLDKKSSCKPASLCLQTKKMLF